MHRHSICVLPFIQTTAMRCIIKGIFVTTSLIRCDADGTENYVVATSDSGERGLYANQGLQTLHSLSINI